MNVLSLFDGMSCGRQALKQANIKVDLYFASEIDKHAMKVAQLNHPENIQVGDVTKLITRNGKLIVGDREYVIDLIIGGSPCQGFSFAGKQLNFNDDRSKLFFEFVRLVKDLSPRFFMLENVKMKKEYLDVISEHLGVQPLFINSSLVSAQNRQRYYWTNIPNVKAPEDRNILLKDVIQDDAFTDRDKSYCIDANYFKGGNPDQYFNKSRRQLLFNYSSSGRGNGKVESRVTEANKAACLTAAGYSNRSSTNVVRITDEKIKTKPCFLSEAFAATLKVDPENLEFRKLTVTECERLQTLPDGYCSHPEVSDSQKYKMLGNGWTVSVIEHIFKNIN